VSLPNLVYFYRRRLRARLVQELFALIGIAVGVALLFAVQVSNTSLSASIVQLTHRLAGDAQLQLEARAPQGLDERTFRSVQRIGAVEAAAPLLEVSMNLSGPKGSRAATLFAADPRFARLGGDLLTGFTSGRLAHMRAIVVPAPLARALGVHFGNSVTLQVRGRSVDAPVGAIVDSNDVGPLADSPTIVSSLLYGQDLSAMQGRISRILVVARPGRVEEARAALQRIAGDRLDIRPADADARLFAQAATPNNQSTSLFAAISALVGFLFAFNALLLLARERRAVIAELRMSGFGATAVVQVLMLDAIVLGLAASLVGLAIGDQLSRHVFRPAPGYLTLAFPVDTARTVHWQIVAVSIAAGVLAAMLATASPLLRAFGRRSIDAIDDDGLVDRERRDMLRSGWLLVVGLGCFAISAIVLSAAPQAALFGTATLAVSMLLVLPTVLRLGLSVANGLRRGLRSVVPLVAIGELESAGSRSVALAAIAAIAVFGSTAIEGAHRDLQRALTTDSHELNAGPDLWVSATSASNVLATTPFPAGVARRLAHMRQIASVQAYRGGFLDLGSRRVLVLGPPRGAAQPIPPSQVVDGDVVTATARIREHGWAVVSQALAKERHLRIGESFRLRAPRPTSFRVAAISTNLGWSPGSVIVNADDYRSAWDSTDVSALHLGLSNGVSPAAGKRFVERALGPRSALTVETPRERELRQQATSRQGLARLTQIATLVLIAASLAIAAAMAAMIWQRRRRLAELKLVGIDDRRLWRALLLESGILLGIGCSLGAAYGAFGQQLLDRALNTVTGFPIDYSVGVLVAVTSGAMVCAVALGIALLPGYLAARVPADAAFQD
jgi:putative ABC transport system permease protein